MKTLLFPKIHWWLLLLIPIVFFGFYPSYFSAFTSAMAVHHVHALFMVTWLTMALIQPWLNHRKKFVLHKKIGRWSYVLMPLVLASAYWVMHHTYHFQLKRRLDVQEASGLTTEEILSQAGEHMALGMVYFVWLLVFYFLAIYFRKKSIAHATFMFAAILTFLGPALDRLLWYVCFWTGIPFSWFFQNFVFGFIVSTLVALVIYQKRKGLAITYSLWAVGIYLAGLVVFFTLPETPPWTAFMSLIF
jgi:hypothetical protein